MKGEDEEEEKEERWLISTLFIAGLTQREGKFSKPARKEEEDGEMQGKWAFGSCMLDSCCLRVQK